MKKTLQSTLLFISCMAQNVLALNATLPLCNSQTPTKTICRVEDLSLLHPTQFNYGQQYVHAKVTSYLANSIPTNQAYLKKRGPLNAVIGPDGLIYVADGHHRVATYIQLSQRQKHPYTIYLKILNNFSKQTSMQSFWQWMESSNDVYLKDKSISRPANNLPKSFAQLTNDKYRSLTGWIAKQHWCFTGSQVNYIEFFWADYFRQLAAQGKIKDYPDYDITTSDGKKDLDKYLSELKKTKACYSITAKNLPGYCQTENDCMQENTAQGAA